MSIIGIVLFPLAFYCIMSMYKDNSIDAAIGWGIISTVYAFPFSIVVFVKSREQKKDVTND